MAHRHPLALGAVLLAAVLLAAAPAAAQGQAGAAGDWTAAAHRGRSSGPAGHLGQ